MGLRVKLNELKYLLKFGSEILLAMKGAKVSHQLLSAKRVWGGSCFRNLGKLKTKRDAKAENGMFDISPCGTGTCGRMDIEYEDGMLGIDDEFESECRRSPDAVFLAD